VNPDFIESPHTTNPNDVAVIVLDRPYSRTFLKLADSAPKKGGAALAAGYGCDKKEGKWSTDFKIGSTRIAGAGKFLSLARSNVEYCEGDSGGPLLVETSNGLRIIGVASYINKVKGVFGLSKDRAVRVDRTTPAREWVEAQLKR
jgi:hypothetical protein